MSLNGQISAVADVEVKSWFKVAWNEILFFSETKHETAKCKMHLQNHQKEKSNWEGPSKMMCCEYEIVSKLFLSSQESWFNVNHKLPSTKYSKHFNVTYLTSHKNLVSQFKIRNHIVVESCFQNGRDFFSSFSKFVTSKSIAEEKHEEDSKELKG